MVTGGITLGMVLTIIIIFCTIIGAGAQFVKSILDGKDMYENEIRNRKPKNIKSERPKKKSYTVIYKDTNRRHK